VLDVNEIVPSPVVETVAVNPHPVEPLAGRSVILGGVDVAGLKVTVVDADEIEL
jgi:hypothetical protein